MPKSQIAPASRLRALLVYVACAFVALLVADAVAQSLGAAGATRRAVGLGWMVFFPVGGWIVWRRG
jgi:hypothetical protein